MIKHVDLKDTAFIEWKNRVEGYSFVFTNGCFDVIHPGHIKLLQYAKSQGHFLIVGLNSDDSVKKLKGKNRPIHCLEDRILILSALSSVDFVIPFSESTPMKLIQLVKPQVLVKGGDYQIKDVVGSSIVRQWGGVVKIFSMEPGHSTTGIIQKLDLDK